MLAGVTTGPILLTGLAVCASCGGGMMLRTGTSKSGRVYRYYTCSNCATKGKSVCKGRSIAMGKLDQLVTEHLIERLFKPERLAAILSSLVARRAEKAASVNARLIALQKEVTDAEEKLARLYRLRPHTGPLSSAAIGSDLRANIAASSHFKDGWLQIALCRP